MSADAEDRFQDLMIRRARQYHAKALWQEKLRTLQEALLLCQSPGFPDHARRTQQILIEIGGIRRRFGQYENGIEILDRALECWSNASPIARAQVLGEQAVLHRHMSVYDQAYKVSEEQYRVVQDSGDTSLVADAQLCRARGLSGMSAYNLAMLVSPPDEKLLRLASDRLNERIRRARDLQKRLVSEDPGNGLVTLSATWELIGMGRLLHVLVAQGKTAEAVRMGHESKQKQTLEDPTVMAYSRFNYGYALWHNDQHQDALQQWSALERKCSSAMVFCKEPTAEHIEHLKLLAKAGIDFDTYDEQGYSALDYAAFSNTEDGRRSIEVVVSSLQKTFASQMLALSPKLSVERLNAKVEEKVALRLGQAKLRAAYRTLLQDHVRPALRTGAADAPERLRWTHACLLQTKPNLKELFDDFHFIRYEDFRGLGRLPVSTDNLAMRCSLDMNELPGTSGNQFIIFFSYRWLGWTLDPPQEGPDDTKNTQWKRMMNAIEEYVKVDNRVYLGRLSIWLDCACISQTVSDRRERGIDSLPLAVTQCNAFISLVDESYRNPAWCAVEATLFRELTESYHLHTWWEHVLTDPTTDRCKGTLSRGNLSRVIDTSKLELTKEEIDRPKIDFLLRQSRLLGKDND